MAVDKLSLIFPSVDTFSQFDTMMPEGMGAEKVMNAEERAIVKKFETEAPVNAETNRFRLDPTMRCVSAETKAADPAFRSKKQRHQSCCPVSGRSPLRGASPSSAPLPHSR